MIEVIDKETPRAGLNSFDEAIDAVNDGVSMGVVLLVLDPDTYSIASTYCEDNYTVGMTGFTEECVTEEHMNPGAGRRSFLTMLRNARDNQYTGRRRF